MEGLLDAAQSCGLSIMTGCMNTSVYEEECERLSRWTVRLGLVITQLRLCMRANEDLRGSKAVFLAVDATVSALRQAESLVAQCAGTAPSSIWPLEDAVEFQSVAAELRSAAAGLAALGDRLPADVQCDAQHVYQQFSSLNFTAAELSETEGTELEQVQQHNIAAAAAAAAVSTPAAAPAPAAPVAASAAPPAAPPEQFTSPQAAIDSGAVALSQQVAEKSRAPPPPESAAAADLQQRQDLQSAAAAAITAATQVLAGHGEAEESEGGEENGQAAEVGGEAGEEERLLEEDMKEEAAEEAEEEAAEAHFGAVVTTPEGETALAPTVPVKGAVPAREPSPLPGDSFAMSAPSEDLGINTLKELKSFHRNQENLAGADEAERQLDATPDTLSLQDQLQHKQQQAGQGAGTGAGEEEVQAQVQVLAALKQLREYEAAMEAGEEAAAAEAEAPAPAAGGNDEATAALATAPVAEPVHKTRSEQVALAVVQNLEELAGSKPEAGAAAPPVAQEE